MYRIYVYISNSNGSEGNLGRLSRSNLSPSRTVSWSWHNFSSVLTCYRSLPEHSDLVIIKTEVLSFCNGLRLQECVSFVLKSQLRHVRHGAYLSFAFIPSRSNVSYRRRFPRPVDIPKETNTFSFDIPHQLCKNETN